MAAVCDVLRAGGLGVARVVFGMWTFIRTANDFFMPLCLPRSPLYMI